MPSVYLWEGKVLIVDGKVAVHEDCCCGEPGQSTVGTLNYSQIDDDFPLIKIILYGELIEHAGEVDEWHLGFQWREKGEEEWNVIGWTLYDDPPGFASFEFDETLTNDEHGLESAVEYEFRAIGVDDPDDPTVTIFGEIEEFSLT